MTYLEIFLEGKKGKILILPLKIPVGDEFVINCVILKSILKIELKKI